MSFAEFQSRALLWVLGSLDEEEMVEFEEGRRAFGEDAERFIHDCRKLNAAMALSLCPKRPREDAREQLLQRVQASIDTENARRDANGGHVPLDCHDLRPLP